MSLSSKYHKCKNMKINKMIKWKTSKLIKKHQKTGGVNFGLKTGSRGTPWNRKSAQPGGSDFAKCQKVPFKWHFGLFQGGVIFCHFFTFLILHFVIFMILWFSDFVTFSLFHFFLFFHFSCFVDFCWFLLIFCCCDQFVSFFVTILGAWFMTHFSSSKPALPLSPLLVVKFDHYFECEMLITFSPFLINF